MAPPNSGSIDAPSTTRVSTQDVLVRTGDDANRPETSLTKAKPPAGSLTVATNESVVMKKSGPDGGALLGALKKRAPDQSAEGEPKRRKTSQASPAHTQSSTGPVQDNRGAIGLIGAEAKRIRASKAQAASAQTETAINKFDTQAGFEKVMKRVGAEPAERATRAQRAALRGGGTHHTANDFIFRFQNPARKAGNLSERTNTGQTRFIEPKTSLTQTQSDVDHAIASYNDPNAKFAPLWLEGHGALAYANVLIEQSSKGILSQPGLNEDQVSVTLIHKDALQAGAEKALISPSQAVVREHTPPGQSFSASIVGVNSGLDKSGFLYTTGQELNEAFAQRRPALVTDLEGNTSLLTHSRFSAEDLSALEQLGNKAKKNQLIQGLAVLTTKTAVTPEARRSLTNLARDINDNMTRLKGRKVGADLKQKIAEKGQALQNQLDSISQSDAPTQEQVKVVRDLAISYVRALKSIKD